MNIEDRIEIGDTVSVNFHGTAYCLTPCCRVMSKPQDTGDSWVFKDVITGAVHYISEGCTITKTPK